MTGKFNFGAVSNTVEKNKKSGVAEIKKEQTKVQQPVEEKKEAKKEVSTEKNISQNVDTIAKNAISKITQIENDLKGFFIERDNEIRIISLALIAGVNAFFYGPAGTGKSALIEEYNKRITNSSYFRWLLSKTTEPGEIFGPTSIESMKKDVFKFNTKGKLPEANIAFLDEVDLCLLA